MSFHTGVRWNFQLTKAGISGFVKTQNFKFRPQYTDKVRLFNARKKYIGDFLWDNLELFYGIRSNYLYSPCYSCLVRGWDVNRLGSVYPLGRTLGRPLDSHRHGSPIRVFSAFQFDRLIYIQAMRRWGLPFFLVVLPAGFSKRLYTSESIACLSKIWSAIFQNDVCFPITPLEEISGFSCESTWADNSDSALDFHAEYEAERSTGFGVFLSAGLAIGLNAS